MGLDLLPHLALGNTKKGVTNIVIGDAGTGGNRRDTGEWLQQQKEDIVESAREVAQAAIVQHVKTINKACVDSSLYTPTLKSLSYFSELDNLVSDRREAQRLIATKNPVAFGAVVYEATKHLMNAFGVELFYHAPSEFVGLEFAKKGLLLKERFFIDYTSKACVTYANTFETSLRRLDFAIVNINWKIRFLQGSIFDSYNKVVADAVSGVLDMYHKFIQSSVRAGVSYTAIEDIWLNKNVEAARSFAPQLLELYNYAEKHSIQYDTPYPSYDADYAEDYMRQTVGGTEPSEYALYSEIFTHIKTEAITATSGTVYQLGYLIPQFVYVDYLMDSLDGFLGELDGLQELKSLSKMINS